MTPTTKFTIKLVVSIALLFFLATKIGIQEVGEIVLSATPSILAIAAVLICLVSFALAWRWALICSAIGLKLPWSESLRLVLIGLFFNQVLPSAIGGDAVRVWILGRRNTAGFGRVFNSVFLDRLNALLGMALMVTAGAPFARHIAEIDNLTAILLAFGGAALIGCLLLASLDKLPPLRALRNVRLFQHLMRMAADTRTLLLSPRVLVCTLVISIAIHGTISTSVWLIAASLGLQLELFSILFLLPMVLFVSMLPISIAGWGVREGAMVVMLGMLGVAPANALAVSLLFGVGSFLAGLPGGIIWLFQQDRRLLDQGLRS